MNPPDRFFLHRYGGSLDFRALLETIDRAKNKDAAIASVVAKADADGIPPIEREAHRDWIPAHRGKPDVRLRAARFLRLCRQKPTVCLRLLADPNIAGITALEIEDIRLGDRAVDAIARSAIDSLDTLSLIGVGLAADSDRALDSDIDEEVHARPDPQFAGAVERLLASPQLRAVRVLDLGGNKKIGTAGVRAIARASALANLEELSLSHCVDHASAGAIEELAASPNLAKLRALAVSRYDLKAPEGFGRPLLSIRSNDLGYLDLCHMGLGDRDLETIAGEARFEKLRELRLQGSDFSTEAIATLFRSPHLTQLRVLTLDAKLTPDLARALVGSRFLPALEELMIADAGGAPILREAPALKPKVKAWADRFANAQA